MKLIIILSLFSLNSFARTLHCEQKGWETQGMEVRTSMTAKINTISSTEVELIDLDLTYKILDFDYVWSEGRSYDKSLSNLLTYKPRKYKKHMKFETSADDNGSSGYGALDLILPIKNLLSSKSLSFKGYLIMTYMDDHFGGTAPLNCTITK